MASGEGNEEGEYVEDDSDLDNDRYNVEDDEVEVFTCLTVDAQV